MFKQLTAAGIISTFRAKSTMMQKAGRVILLTVRWKGVENGF